MVEAYVNIGSSEKEKINRTGSAGASGFKAPCGLWSRFLGLCLAFLMADKRSDWTKERTSQPLRPTRILIQVHKYND